MGKILPIQFYYCYSQSYTQVHLQPHEGTINISDPVITTNYPFVYINDNIYVLPTYIIFTHGNDRDVLVIEST